ncbi:MAG: lysophospholipid acyltransferase family protein [Bacteroidetes bacterium]|nr:lysophospholipid acyltransferase family protein [Bacteroidota bacterium]
MDNRPLRKRIKYASIYWSVRFMIFLSGLVPRRLWLAFFGWLGKIAYAFPSVYKERVIFHLGLPFSRELSVKEILALSKRVYVMIGKNAGDIIRSRNAKTLGDLDKFIKVHGYENFEAATAKDKGVIFLTGHLGAFDLQITVMSMRGLKPNIIGTPLKDDRLNDLLFDFRNAHGAVAVERGKETFRLIKALKSKGSVAILIDQDTKVKSRFVNFFGMPAATPVGATVLAMKTGAAVVPTFIYLGDDHYQHMEILPEIPLVLTGDEEKDLVSNTQRFTDVIEEAIRRHPDQWVWLHERWKTKPGEEIV